MPTSYCAADRVCGNYFLWCPSLISNEAQNALAYTQSCYTGTDVRLSLMYGNLTLPKQREQPRTVWNPRVMSPQKTSRRKLARRACDGCKVRKIKCSEVSPCVGCEAAKIPCTFIKLSATRGPRALRAKTFQSIAESQGLHRTYEGITSQVSPDNASTESSIETSSDLGTK